MMTYHKYISIQLMTSPQKKQTNQTTGSDLQNYRCSSIQSFLSNFTSEKDLRSSLSIYQAQTLEVNDLDHSNIILFDKQFYRKITKIQSKIQPQITFFQRYLEQLEQNKRKIFQLLNTSSKYITPQLMISQLNMLFRRFPIPITLRSTLSDQSCGILHEAVKKRQFQVCKYLISLQPFQLLQMRDSCGRTPIHYSIMYGNDQRIFTLFLQFLENRQQKMKGFLNYENQFLNEKKYISLINITDNNGNTLKDYSEFYSIGQNLMARIQKILVIGINDKDQEKTNLQKRKKNNLNQQYQLMIVQQKQIKYQLLKYKETKKKLKKQIKLNHKFMKFYSQIAHSLNSALIQNIQNNTFKLQEHFQILKLIGEGGFAKVFKIKCRKTAQIFALKTLQKSILTDQIVRYSVQQKNLLKNINHANIVKLYATFQDSNFLYLLLEYLPYYNIKKIFKQQQNRLYNKKSNCAYSSQTQLRYIAAQLIEALGYLHQKMILYRDLKPENLCLDEKGNLKLIDFGLSKKLKFWNQKHHSFCGTCQYMAPQMIDSYKNGQKGTAIYGLQVDWFMLGVILYELMNNKRPDCTYQKINQKSYKRWRNNKIKQSNNIIGNDQKNQIDFNCILSQQLEDFILKLLEQNPQKRLGRIGDAQQIKKHPWFNDFCWNKQFIRKHSILNNNQFDSSNEPSQIDSNQINIMNYFKQSKQDIKQNFIFIEGWQYYTNIE